MIKSVLDHTQQDQLHVQPTKLNNKGDERSTLISTHNHAIKIKTGLMIYYRQVSLEAHSSVAIAANA